MKETLVLLANYNVWANKKWIDILLKLREGQVQQEIVSSFPTIKDTVYHMWSAEYIWLQRLQLAAHPAWMATAFSGSFGDACAQWQSTSAALQQFVEAGYDDKYFAHVFQYYNLQKQSKKSSIYAALLHVFNHSTYHRGQLTTMARQVGVKKIPSTDLFLFANSKA